MTDEEEKEVKDMMWVYPGNKPLYNMDKVSNMIHKYISVPDYEYNIAVGTDSQMIGKKFQFISVISIHRVGKGGIYFYNKEMVPRAKFPVQNQKLRMFDEVSRSIALGLYLKDEEKIVPEIHVDASPPNKGEFTSKFSDQLRGYVVSCGFEFVLKPTSYAAMAIADKHTKKKRRGRRHKRRFQEAKYKKLHKAK